MFVAAAHAESRMDLIKKRGVLIVGVKTDYPPFGMLSPDATLQGFEHDLAEDLARGLGVALRKVAVTGANRLQVLDEGGIDLTIATLGDTYARRQIADLIEPNYYSSGVTLMTRPDSKLDTWADVRGQKVCATQGSYFNRAMATRYLLDLQIFANGRDAKLAVRDGRCAGWLFDNTAIAGDLLSDEWKYYKTKLRPQLLTPWAIAIARSEKGGALERFIGDTVAQWHRRGFLLELEKKWRLPPSIFLTEMHTLWNEKDEKGAFVCRRLPDGQWPVVCRNPIFITSTETTGLRQFGLLVKEKTGVNLTFIYDDYERDQFIRALFTTLALTASCVFGSLVSGMIFALAIEQRIPLLSQFLKGFTLIGRMTPPLLQIYVLAFGIGSVLAANWGIQLNSFLIVVLCLCWYTGSGILHILENASDKERLRDPGFRLNLGTLRAIASRCSTSILASLVNVSKATMMASAVAVPELLSVSTSIIAEHGTVATMMNTLMLLFLVLVFVVLRLLQRVERRWCHGMD
jgi:polar amino acid transport system substrate-binding protein